VNFSSKQFIASCFVIFLFFKPSFVAAQSSDALPVLAERWAKNAIAIERSTKNLYATNALLAEENKNLSSQVAALEEKIRALSVQFQDMDAQKKQLESDQKQKRKNFFSFLRQTTKTIKTVEDFTKEESTLRGELEKETTTQKALAASLPQLHQDISRFEQNVFLQQRRDQEAARQMNNLDSAAQGFLESKRSDQETLNRFFENANSFAMDSYQQLKELAAEKKALMTNVQDRRAELEKIRNTGEELEALAADYTILQEENESLKNELLSQKHDMQNSQKIIVSPQMESLALGIEDFREKNNLLKKQITFLSQAFNRLNKQKLNIEKTLQKK